MAETTKDFLLVAAIDFGTTFSGYAFSTRFDYKANPLNISSITWTAGTGNLQSQKTSTCILFEEDESFHSFGFDAEDKFAELAGDDEHHDWLFFRRFKMQLYDKEKLDKSLKIEAHNGKSMNAMKVFSAAIGHLKEELMKLCYKKGERFNNTDILWVLTVPAIWSEPAKQFMRQAAEEAGIPKTQLKLVLEPVAAAIYCNHLTKDKLEPGENKCTSIFTPGSRYLVLDAGGGTVDITLQEVQRDGTLKEIHKATGGDWGGTMVDRQFENLLETLVGKDPLNDFKKEHADDWLSLCRNFEVKKREKIPDGMTTFRIPYGLQTKFKQSHPMVAPNDGIKKHFSDSTWAMDRMRLPSDVAEGLFKASHEKITNHIKGLLKSVKGVSVIVMVGGYSECGILESAVRSAFPDLKVIVPNEAGLGVLKGAVLSGHAPQIITQRACRSTCGIASSSKFIPGKNREENKIKGARGDDRCIDVFKHFVDEGDSITLGDSTKPRKFTVIDATETGIDQPVHASTSKTPRYVTEDCCQTLGFQTRFSKMAKTTKDFLLVAAIDFGTTFSGYAFSTRFDYKANPLNISSITWTAGTGNLQSQKTSTCILFEEDESFHSFGFDAEDKFAELAGDDEHHDWLFFRRFKMQLYGKEKLDKSLKIEAHNGKSMNAMKVFSAAIGHLKEELMKLCDKQGAGVNHTDILWVLTVPAIWSEPAKQFMRQAAEEAGIPKTQLKLVLEPEAAAIYCNHLTKDKLEAGENKCTSIFTPGSRYLVLDAGGGTVDITLQEVQRDGTLKEIHKATGGDWGGTMVDRQFENLLETLVGKDPLNDFKKEHADDWLSLCRNFEVKKREKIPDGKTTFRIPYGLQTKFKQSHPKVSPEDAIKKQFADSTWSMDKMRLPSVVTKGLFKASHENITKHIKGLLKSVKGVSVIVMVGGYSECGILESAVRSAFPDLKVIVPNEAGLCVLKGAVLSGHAPKIITQRVCRFTYGIATSSKFIPGKDREENKIKGARGDDRCIDVFKHFVDEDDTITVGDSTKPRKFTVSDATETGIDLPVYASTSKTPRYVTEDCCQKLGLLKIELPDTSRGIDRGVHVQMVFGGTELEVKAIDINTKKETKSYFNFLS